LMGTARGRSKESGPLDCGLSFKRQERETKTEERKDRGREGNRKRFL